MSVTDSSSVAGSRPIASHAARTAANAARGLLGALERREVELVGIAGGQRGRAARTGATDEDRWMRLLHRFRERRAVGELVVRAGEGERLADRRLPDPGDDRELLLEALEALAERRERDAVRGCSCSFQPAPSAERRSRPPLMASTWATVIASGPGSRNVAELTIVPSRTRSVSRARPASVTHESVGPGSPTASNPR